jgi:hypothetical protein
MQAKLGDGIVVSLTIYSIQSSLLKDFMEQVVNPQYPHGISDAIKDLMRKAVQEQTQKSAIH